MLDNFSDGCKRWSLWSEAKLGLIFMVELRSNRVLLTTRQLVYLYRSPALGRADRSAEDQFENKLSEPAWRGISCRGVLRRHDLRDLTEVYRGVKRKRHRFRTNSQYSLPDAGISDDVLPQNHQAKSISSCNVGEFDRGPVAAVGDERAAAAHRLYRKVY